MHSKSNLHFYFFAVGALGKGLSGSDRIFIELARRWSKEYSTEIFVWKEGREMCRRQGLREGNVVFRVLNIEAWSRYGFVFNYIMRIFVSIREALKIKVENLPCNIIYSASDFWMDSLPGLIIKLRFPKVTWIGSWYLTAPNPFLGFKEGEASFKFPKLNTLFYWLSQRPVNYFLKRWADFIFITSEPDRLKFPEHQKSHIVVIRGGVNIHDIDIWKEKFKTSPKVYDAVFQGRFHPQKGVIELLEIWKMVTDTKKDAQLIMIGDGPLMEQVKEEIRKLNLENNVTLTGHKDDGEEKYKIFYQSRVVVHPVIYDSGGMGAAEAMAWGLPAVGFDLEALKSYYPEGMLKAPIGDKKEFAKLILDLFNNKRLYNQTATDAKMLIKNFWNWDTRSEEILKAIDSGLGIHN